MALVQKHGTTPVSSCLPLLVQMPVFFSLFSVLNDRRRARRWKDLGGVGLLKARADAGVLQREAVRRRVAARESRAPSRLQARRALPPIVILVIARRADDRVAVLHAAADHLEEPVAGGQDRPGVPDAEHHALRPAAGASSSPVSSSRSASSSTGSSATCGRWASSSSSSARCRRPGLRPPSCARSAWPAAARPRFVRQGRPDGQV